MGTGRLCFCDCGALLHRDFVCVLGLLGVTGGYSPLFALPTDEGPKAFCRFRRMCATVCVCVCVCVVFGGFTRGASARLSAKMCVYLDSIHLSYSGGQVPHRVCVCVCDADGILIKYSGVYVNLYAHMLSQDQPVWA